MTWTWALSNSEPTGALGVGNNREALEKEQTTVFLFFDV